jgi:hypothetical protein
MEEEDIKDLEELKELINLSKNKNVKLKLESYYLKMRKEVVNKIMKENLSDKISDKEKEEEEITKLLKEINNYEKKVIF